MWTDEQIYKAKWFEGTCTSVSEIADQLDLSEDDTEELMLDANMELCGGCGWWHACSDLEFDESRNLGFCRDCEPDLHET
jgi:hypothetical protein